MNYPLRTNKYNWRSLEPQTNVTYTEDYIADHYDLYLTSEYITDDGGIFAVFRASDYLNSFFCVISSY